ncbi:MAG TPA: PPK2 family polyphosphate kinase, partial [Jatrophihabitantaceae bacterium]|nr:PPK2 family polyphosphate kinase [Jatrophihabitantaceae bacterium]
MKQSLRELLAVPSGSVTIAGFDPSATPLVERGKSGRLKLPTDDSAELADLQERLYAEATVGSRRSVLLVLQGMDTSGKGGTTDHVVNTMRPTGVRYTAFKAPTDEERSHDFLWRIRPHVPVPGIVGVFDRSHYEDVLIVRVHDLVPEDEWESRYAQINAFEAELADGGTTIVKCFLNISYDTQRERLLARLDDPDKRWKFNEADVDERQRWTDYMAAYEAMLERCSTHAAPWYVVPADSKKYRNWAVGHLLLETMREMNPQFPDRPDLDVDAVRARL